MAILGITLCLFHLQKQKMPPPGIAPGLPAPQAGVLLLYYSGGGCGGSGYRSRFSTLRRLYATMYNNPPCASIGTRTRILTLEGLNTTLVLWTHDSCRPSVPGWDYTGAGLRRTKKKDIRLRHQPDSNRRGQSPPDFESGALTTRP